MSRRLTALLAAPALAAVLAGGCADEAAAARVGDTTISDDDLMAEVEAYRDNEGLWQSPEQAEEQLGGEAPGSFSQEVMGSLLQNRIRDVFVEEIFEEEGLKLTDGSRADAEEELAGQDGFGPAFFDFPKDLQDRLIDATAMRITVGEELGNRAAQAALTELVEETDVEISSRYGTWDPVLFLSEQPAVVPPAGPVQPDAEGDDLTEVQP